MADTFHRLFRILQLIPRHPKVIDTDALSRALASEGLDPEMRTLQRDLKRLEGMALGLQCMDTSKPFRWSFQKDARALMVPGLDPQAALALRLVELHLERLVPKATLKALQPHLQAAKTALEHKPVAKWLDKVRLIPRHQPLVPPKIDGNVTGVVHEALLEQRQIAVHYKSSSGDKELTLHPLGLVHRDAVAYLVATALHYSDPRLYSMHRFTQAELLADKSKIPSGFDLDAYIAKGELGFLISDGPVEIALLFDASAGKVVEETPLTEQQRVTKQADGHVLVEAKVPDTQVLRAWLLGFGPGVVVQKPAVLRKAIAEAHRAALARYA